MHTPAAGRYHRAPSHTLRRCGRSDTSAMAAKVRFMPSSHAFGEDAIGTSCGGSLLFAFEGEDAHNSAGAVLRAAATASHQASIRERLSFIVRPSNDFVIRLQHDVRRFKRALLREDGSSSERVDVVGLAARLSAVGHAVTIRTALGGGSACFKNLRHVFLRVRGDADFEGAEFIVDPNFSEHFAIPHPTDAYAATLALLPDEFIGSSSRLVPLVQIMCTEMAASFEAKGLTLPPWRRAQAMLSKWLPQRMSDQPLSSSAQRCSSSGASVEGTSPGSEGSGPGGDSDDDCGGASSPFCRISAVEVQRASKRAGRTGSSLLSGKLCSSSAGSNSGKAVACAGDGKDGSNACAGALTRRTSSGGGGGVGAAAAIAGSVNRCPPMYRGEPATYSVKLPQAPAQ